MMNGYPGLTSVSAQIIEESLHKVFLPTLLKMILPYIIAIIVFGVIRVIAARLLQGRRALKNFVDAVILLVFLAFCGFVLFPITTHFITSGDITGSSGISIPEHSGSDPFSDISVPEYSGEDPFKISS